jgi:pimeloyl-ACP methyl ester carboxylesterase
VSERIPYDEFGLFHENADEYGLPFTAPPRVARREVSVAPDRAVSALVWGHAADPAEVTPEVVFVHGGAQNAHTWDTVIMALGRPAVAVDLPGHGHSGWRADGAYSPANLADDVAVAVQTLAPAAALVVGMSLGGLTSMELAARHPQLVRSLMMIDITPGVNGAKTKAITDFVDGPQSFPSFEALLQRTQEHNPTRSERSLRRGILHNAHQLPDGSWQWNYDRGSRARAGANATPAVPTAEVDPTVTLSPLWDDFGSITCPVTLVRGGVSPVVDDDDVAEARRRQPQLQVHVVDGAGHSVQGDRPLELAALIAATLAD